MNRRSRSSSRWLREHFADPFVQRAQRAGWR
ncbi:MAG: 23S rRNA methyltransferase, partial [Gammaproteobacteria bacterium]|nr:23S rRNA methyltransferase [Gammaproteobacteria bacterium]